MSDHSDHGSAHGDSTKSNSPQQSTYYRNISLLIAAIFACIIAIILVFKLGDDSSAVVENPTSTVTYFIPDSIDMNGFKYFYIEPNTSYQFVFDTTENYPEDFPDGSDLISRVDDRGQNPRPFTPYIIVTSRSKYPVRYGMGRRNLEDPSIVFSGAPKSLVKRETVSSFAVISLRWFVIFLVLFVLIEAIYRFWYLQSKEKGSPGYWVKPIDGHDAHDTHNAHAHDDHATKSNGNNKGFNTTLTMTIMYGVATIIFVAFVSIDHMFYALIPFIGFVNYDFLIAKYGIVVPLHTLLGAYSKFATNEVCTLHQGDAFVLKGMYTLGDPAAPKVTINLDKINVNLEPEAADGPDANKVKLKDGVFVYIREPRAFLHALPDAGTEWLSMFEDGDLKTLLEKYVDEIYWSAVGIVASQTDSEDMYEVVKRKINKKVNGAIVEKDHEGYEFSEKVDAQMRLRFDADGAKIEGHTTMSQPAFTKDMEEAIQLKAVMIKAKDALKVLGIKANDKSLAEEAKIWLNKTKQETQIFGLNEKTLESLSAFLMAKFVDKK